MFPDLWPGSSISCGTFYLAKIFGWKFWKLSVSNGKTFFSIRSTLAISLVDQKTYEMAQEDNKMETKILRKWTAISVLTGYNRKSGVLPKVVRLFQKIPFDLRVSFLFQPVKNFGWMAASFPDVSLSLSARKGRVVPRASSPVSRVSRSPSTKMRNWPKCATKRLNGVCLWVSRLSGMLCGQINLISTIRGWDLFRKTHVRF